MSTLGLNANFILSFFDAIIYEHIRSKCKFHLKFLSCYQVIAKPKHIALCGYFIGQNNKKSPIYPDLVPN